MGDMNFSAIINDLNSQIASGAKTSADFNQIANIGPSYWKGLEQAYTQGQRDAFKNGMPMQTIRGPGGQPIQAPDYNKISDTLLRTQGVPGLQTALGLQQMLYSQRQNEYLQNGPPRQGDVPPAATAPNAGVRQTSQPITPDSTKWVSPAEGERTGIYGPTPADPNNPDAPQRAAQLQPTPVQTTSYTPNNPQGVPTAPGTVMPGSDPSYGGLVPDWMVKQYGDQAASAFYRLASGMLANGNVPKDQAAALTERLKSLEKIMVSRGTPTDAQKEYEYAVRSGAFRGSQQEFEIKKKAEEARVKQEADTSTHAVNLQVTNLANDSKKSANDAYKAITVSNDLIAQLDKKNGIFSGAWAGERQKLTKIAVELGIAPDMARSKIQNTETFQALVGEQVAALVKAFGAGTGISNADRAYAEKMAAGDITLDEGSIRRLLQIRQKYSRIAIMKHNDEVDDISQANPSLARRIAPLKVNLDGVRVKTPEEARKLKTGTKFINPDGELLTAR